MPEKYIDRSEDYARARELALQEVEETYPWGRELAEIIRRDDAQIMALEATPEPPLPAVMDRKTQIACNALGI